MKYLSYYYASLALFIGLFSFSFGALSGYYDTEGRAGIALKSNSYEAEDRIVYRALINNNVRTKSAPIEQTGGNVFLLKNREILTPRLIIGESIFSIPLLGYPLLFLRTKFGLFAFAYLPTMIYLIYLAYKKFK